MPVYQVRYAPRTDRDLGKLPLQTKHRVIGTILTLCENPYDHIKKLKGTSLHNPVYSLRIGRDIRALLSIHDDVCIIHILEVDLRKTACRDF
jgi:mRNA interferase RelE/StbE